jgi:hypothetical protein
MNRCNTIPMPVNSRSSPLTGSSQFRLGCVPISKPFSHLDSVSASPIGK